MTTRHDFQVIEVKHGYAVRDRLDGSIWSRTYTYKGWAIRAAVKLQGAHSKRRYF